MHEAQFEDDFEREQRLGELETPPSAQEVSPEDRALLEEKNRVFAELLAAARRTGGEESLALAPEPRTGDVQATTSPDTVTTTVSGPSKASEAESSERLQNEQERGEAPQGDGAKVAAVLAQTPSPASAMADIHAPTTQTPALSPATPFSKGQKAKAVAQSLVQQPSNPQAAPTDRTSMPGLAAGPGDRSWESFLAAIANNESGGRTEGIIDAGSRNASGQTASYGRYQTTAAAATDVLKDPGVKEQFGFTQAEVEGLGHAMHATDQFWAAIVEGQAVSLSKAETGGAAMAITKDDIELAAVDPDSFIEKFGAVFTKATGMPVEQMRRMFGVVHLRKAIDERKAEARAGQTPQEQKANRQRIAKEIWEKDKIIRDLGFEWFDLTTYLRVDAIAEHRAGFQMKAALATQPKLFDALNRNAGEDFGRHELAHVRGAVIRRGKMRYGIDVTAYAEEKLFMLCARAHNKGVGTLQQKHYEEPTLLEKDDYVAKMLAFYRHGGRDGGHQDVTNRPTVTPQASPKPAQASRTQQVAAGRRAGISQGPSHQHGWLYNALLGEQQQARLRQAEQVVLATAHDAMARIKAGFLAAEHTAEEFLLSFHHSEERKAGVSTGFATGLAKQIERTQHEGKKIEGGSPQETQQGSTGAGSDSGSHKLIELARGQATQHADEWAPSGSLASVHLTNAHFQGQTYKGLYKCNIFIGEMLYRSGYLTAGEKGSGAAARVEYPDVNGMCADAERVAQGGEPEPKHGVRWFDIVKPEEVRPGDIVMIRGKYRGDVKPFKTDGSENHGHIEIITSVQHLADGELSEVKTIGATGHGAKEQDLRRRTTFGTKGPHDSYHFNEHAWIIRPRLRSG